MADKVDTLKAVQHGVKLSRPDSNMKTLTQGEFFMARRRAGTILQRSQSPFQGWLWPRPATS